MHLTFINILLLQKNFGPSGQLVGGCGSGGVIEEVEGRESLLALLLAQKLAQCLRGVVQSLVAAVLLVRFLAALVVTPVVAIWSQTHLLMVDAKVLLLEGSVQLV